MDYLGKYFYFERPDGFGYMLVKILARYKDDWYWVFNLDYTSGPGLPKFSRVHVSMFNDLELYDDDDVQPVEVLPDLEHLINPKQFKSDPTVN